MDGIEQIDSTRVVKGQFSFKKKLPIPVTAVMFTDKKQPPVSLFLENGIYRFAIANDSIHVLQAPPTQEQHQSFVRIQKSLADLFPIWGRLSEEKDTAGLKKLGLQFDSIHKRTTELAKTYFHQNPTSPIALYLFEKFAPASLDYAQNEPYYLRLPPWAKRTDRGKVIGALIEGAKKTRIGMEAPLFEQRDTSGQLVGLSSFRGKFLLIDFWASWCTPCRQENPNVVKAYQQFRDRGFNILGVSLEYKGDKSKWVKAIEKDNLQWTHVSGLSFFRIPWPCCMGFNPFHKIFSLIQTERSLPKI